MRRKEREMVQQLEACRLCLRARKNAEDRWAWSEYAIGNAAYCLNCFRVVEAKFAAIKKTKD